MSTPCCELLTEHLQQIADNFGEREDRLRIYCAEIKGFYRVVGEFDGAWAGDQYMFWLQFDREGKFERGGGEVTAELIKLGTRNEGDLFMDILA